MANQPSIGTFLGGAVMFSLGMYLLLSSIHVNVGWGGHLYQMGNVGVTSGMLLIPFFIGVVMVFFNAKNYVGWLMMVGAVVLIIVGVIMNINFNFRSMNLFQLLLIFVLSAGGAGLLLKSAFGK